MLLTKKSLLSGKEHQMFLPITEKEYEDWQLSGELIQNVFPNLTDDQREFMISGSTPEEWDEAFGEEDEL